MDFRDSIEWFEMIAQNDAHPYVERCIARCRVVHEAMYASGAGSGGAKGHSPTVGTSKTMASGKVGAKSPTVAADAPGEAVATTTRGTSPGRGNGEGNGAGLGGGLGSVVPARARTPAWMGVVDAALLSLLRGFSRAKRCSTEGRALMSMDLQARLEACHVFMGGLERGEGFPEELMEWGKGREVRIGAVVATRSLLFMRKGSRLIRRNRAHGCIGVD